MKLIETREAEATLRPGCESGDRKYFGCAHKDRGVRVDRGIAGGKTDMFGSEEVDEIKKFLRHEGFDRSSPHRPLSSIEGQQNPRRGHQALA